MDYQLAKITDGRREQIAVGTKDEMLALMADKARETADDPTMPAYSVHPVESKWITRKAAMEMLGVSKGRMSQLVSSGRIAHDGKLVALKDVQKQMQFAGKRGVRRKISVWSDEGLHTLEVTSSEERDGVEMVHAWVDEIGSEIAVLLWPDGTVMTLPDWQGVQPSGIDEIADFDWIVADESGWQPTVMVDGIPRDGRL